MQLEKLVSKYELSDRICKAIGPEELSLMGPTCVCWIYKANKPEESPRLDLHENIKPNENFLHAFTSDELVDVMKGPIDARLVITLHKRNSKWMAQAVWQKLSKKQPTIIAVGDSVVEALGELTLAVMARFK